MPVSATIFGGGVKKKSPAEIKAIRPNKRANVEMFNARYFFQQIAAVTTTLKKQKSIAQYCNFYFYL